MFASVIVSVSSNSVDRLFTYKIPDSLVDTIRVGHRVFIPFGNRDIQGFVIDITETTEFDISKVKEINRIMDGTPVLTKELIQLSKKIATYYIDRQISVIEAILPVALKAKTKTILKLSETAGSNATELFDELQKNNEIVVSNLDKNHLKSIIPFMKSGEFVEETIVAQHTKKKTNRAVRSLNTNRMPSERAVKQRELLEWIESEAEPVTLLSIKDAGYSVQVIDALEKRGLVERVDIVVDRDPYESRVFFEAERHTLNKEQQVAFNKIEYSMKQYKHETFLLHGVTGSGKTEVYLEAIESALEAGKDAIMLVPEIALTPQMVNRFKARFGDYVAVLHSALSHGEKYDEWRKIKEGRARISIGARSSIFAPFKNVGVIIIDEEHESTYKQGERPLYDARQVAKWRAEYFNCPLILGSATPSLESYARSEKGVFTRLELKHRAKAQPLPETTIVDMALSRQEGNISIVSDILREKIIDRIQKEEQIILLLNRRGYAHFLLCQDCGHVPMCPNCDISLTYHKSNGTLMCHYCAYETSVPNKCPECQSSSITFRGSGTEKVEEILRDMFNTEVVRMDIDTTRNKGKHETLLMHFEDENIPILLGTQMIAKGLDFPNVTLVGVLNADTTLNIPDFRANERTFQLLTQVAGRAGRGDKTGEVIFQTYNPDHYSILDAQMNRYKEFYMKEMEYRRIARYSPYFFHVLFIITSENLEHCVKASHDISKILLENISNQSIVIGPSPSPIERINNRFRFQILLKYRHEPTLKDILEQLDQRYYVAYKKSGVSLRIDVDPQFIM
ncbi:primosomal protein N' [Phocicoccus pinnipedialis]|uniref:Replication restart protein PriA n=1 Tax=Phocicoccus pinnipedialis TaxID=110845 RepID=A0A6V7RGA2_9BACL|nr:primosomal protein N' [Jeotgalicoccus pinnipedialis]MBP1939063.1 primosomal protein N' (replication factor Y) [Jeotgalicoccus pinnipedialis]CAD2076959.1 Primosomal protein N' [Jeotgalicoccus pinnipedialis]